MSDETISLTIEDAVATLTLNRPDSANGMNLELMKEFVEAVHTCEEMRARAVIITGAGRFYSAGGDLAAFSSRLERLPRLLNELTMFLHMAISRLVRLDAPVIAAVNGPCAGAGMSLACACDYVLASDSASFSMAYTAAGLSPDGSSSYFLPRRVGDLRARELMLTNRKLSAEEALDWGLVNRVVPADALRAEAQEMATTFSTGPTQSFGLVKSLLHESFNLGLETQMELEARGIVASARTEDALEGITAFLEKRKAKFSGR